MNTIYVGIAALILSATPLSAQGQMQSIEDEMNRLSVQTVALGGGGGVDEYPAWSKDGRYLAFNLMGEWIGIDMHSVEIASADWKGQVIGVLRKANDIRLDSIDGYIGTKTENMRSVTLANGDVYKLDGRLGTSLTKTVKGKEEVVWRGDFENCFGFNPSPNETLLAFICEQNGLFVMQARVEE
jgi:hypothetical protein